MKKLGMLAAVIVLSLLTACGSTGGTAAVNATGTWIGTVTQSGGGMEVPLQLALTDTDGAITGDAVLLGLEGRVDGARTGRDAVLHITGEFLDDITLDGQFGSSSFAGAYIVDGGQTGTVDLARD